jgi:DNA-directed RNA polymerase specialized sigma24 family protein
VRPHHQDPVTAGPSAGTDRQQPQLLGTLPPDGQQLIALLIADPPVPYAEISTRLGIPVGSIGPKRSRCLDRVRRDPALATLISAADAA